jgi:hypothetical protein
MAARGALLAMFKHATLRQKLSQLLEKPLQILDFYSEVCYNNYVPNDMAPAVREHPGARATRGELVTEHRIARFTRPSSRRHHRCDYPFLDLLEQDFGISQFSLRSAFMGVPPTPKRQAIALCELAVNAADGDPEEAGELLREWAKKQGVGSYDPRLIDAPELTWEQTAHERAIGEGQLI